MEHMYLRTARERLKWTQEQLESRSGIAQNTISKLESGKILRPAYATVVALASALRIDPGKLRFGLSPSRRRRKVAA